MLLTLTINSLNSTALLIAIQTKKPDFESSRRWHGYTNHTLLILGGGVNTYFNRNFGFRKESQTLKIMALSF